MKQNEQLQQPFFARFLETQMVKDANTQGNDSFPPVTAVLKDHPHQTDKYPSDNDEDGFPTS